MQLRNIPRNKRRVSKVTAFTLVEVLVTALILTFIIAGIFAVLNVADISWHTDMGLVELQQQARLAMEVMIREIRQSGRLSYNIAVDANGTGITFSIPNMLNIRYYLDTTSHQIIRQQPVDTGTSKILANDIDSLSYCWWDGVDCCDDQILLEDCSNLYVLKIQLRATTTVRQRPLAFSLTEKVRLRNKNE